MELAGAPAPSAAPPLADEAGSASAALLSGQVRSDEAAYKSKAVDWASQYGIEPAHARGLLALVPIFDVATDVCVWVVIAQSATLLSWPLLALLTLSWRFISIYAALSPNGVDVAALVYCPFLLFPNFLRIEGLPKPDVSSVRDLYDAVGSDIEDAAPPLPDPDLVSPAPAPNAAPEGLGAKGAGAVSLWSWSSRKPQPDTIRRSLYGPEPPLLRRYLRSQHDAFRAHSNLPWRALFLLSAELKLTLVSWTLGPLLVWRAALTLAIERLYPRELPASGTSAASDAPPSERHELYLRILLLAHAGLSSAPQLCVQTAILLAAPGVIDVRLYAVSMACSVASVALAVESASTERDALSEILSPPATAFEQQARDLAAANEVHSMTLLTAITAAVQAGIEAPQLLPAIWRLREERVMEVRARRAAADDNADGGSAAAAAAAAALAAVAVDGYLISEGKLAGLSELQMRQSGFTATELRAAGYSAGELRSAFDATELTHAGFPLADLASVGFDAAALVAAGHIDAAALKAVGFSAADLRAARFELGALWAAEYSATELSEAGATLPELVIIGLGASALLAAGFEDASELRSVGLSASDLRQAGMALDALRQAGFSVAQLAAAEYTLSEIHEVGFSATEMREGGFESAGEMRSVGVEAMGMLAAGFTLEQLHEAGYSAKELHDAGCDVPALKEVGYELGELKEALFTASQLKASGFSLLDLRGAGFEQSELHIKKLDPELLRSATFSIDELTNSGILSAPTRGTEPVEPEAAGGAGAGGRGRKGSPARGKSPSRAAAALLSAGGKRK